MQPDLGRGPTSNDMYTPEQQLVTHTPMFRQSLRQISFQPRFQPGFRLQKSLNLRQSSDLVSRVSKVIMATNPHVTKYSDLSSSDAKWIDLKLVHYVDVKGQERVWEVAKRKTTSSSGVDAVAIGNIIYHPSKPPSTMLVLQFRPPLDATSVEWPAGLIDKDETAEEAAVRELKEETGYEGKVISVSPVVAADPGMTTANMKLVMVEIHLKEGDPEPQQNLDEGEHIQRLIVPLSELCDRLTEFANRDRFSVAAKLYHWALGAQFAMKNPGMFEQGGKSKV